MTDQLKLITLALAIADSTAMSDIELFCPREQCSLNPGDTWYNTAGTTDEYDRECVDMAVRYLDLKGELEHHPKDAKLVRKR